MEINLLGFLGLKEREGEDGSRVILRHLEASKGNIEMQI